MIGWIYSVAGFYRGVTAAYQKKSEGTKTVVDTSNHFRIVSNVVCDDFMQLERLLGAEQVPSRLAAPPRVPCTVIEQPNVSSVTNLSMEPKVAKIMKIHENHEKS